MEKKAHRLCSLAPLGSLLLHGTKQETVTSSTVKNFKLIFKSLRQVLQSDKKMWKFSTPHKDINQHFSIEMSL